MEGYDAVVSPTLPTVTYPVGLGFDKAYPKYPGGPSLISPGNLAGLPALALPERDGTERAADVVRAARPRLGRTRAHGAGRALPARNRLSSQAPAAGHARRAVNDEGPVRAAPGLRIRATARSGDA